MSDPSRPPSIKRVLLVTICGAGPAMLLAAYLVSLGRAFLEGVHPLFYLLCVLVAMVAALWLIAGRLLKDLGEHTKWRQEQREKARINK